MIKKLQKNIRVRMNSSKMLNIKLMEDLNSLENLKKELKLWFEF